MTIMRGGPGSGKSRFVRHLLHLSISAAPLVCSADKFFTDDEGVYDFDPVWLGRAHGACLKRCVEAIMLGRDIIIDNTNSKAEEMLPYLALCQAFSYSCTVVRVLCPPELAWGRQTHAVPRDKFDDIHATVARQQVPKLYRGAPWLMTTEIQNNCGCGVGLGLRGDHESQCKTAYL
jgi:predicted kinase